MPVQNEGGETSPRTHSTTGPGTASLRKYIRGTRAADIAQGVESAIAAGALAPGDRLPTVRGLAAHMGVSPTTVSAAFATLKRRGLLSTRGRNGTVVSPRPPVATPAVPDLPLPAGVRDLSAGNPNPAFLPDLRPVLQAIDLSPHLYSTEVVDSELERLARRSFSASGVQADTISVTNGALDGIERVLQAHLRPGDRVAVEDPGFTGVLHLLASMGLVAVPVPIDDSGPLPDAVDRVLADGVKAFVVTPRAQNPRGAALDPQRIGELQPLFREHSDVLLVEDDHAGAVAGVPALSLCDAPPERWAVVRSVSKAYGPDLRLAVMASDAVTVARVEGRQLIGIRWVSFLLQRTVVALWKDAGVRRQLDRAARGYATRRRALIEALASHGIRAYGRSGLNVWVPVPDEALAVRELRSAGYAVRPGERFRLESEPAIRITIATLAPSEAPALAEVIARVLDVPAGPTRRTLSS